MNGISDDDNLGYIVGVCSLVDATPDSKEFCFSARDKNHMMYRLCKGFVVCVYVHDRSSDIVLNSYIKSYDGD